MRANEFSASTKREALERQGYRCASCGTPISGLRSSDAATHAFGEGAQAHHLVHVKHFGSDRVDNCVILCTSCHYSAHEGGNFRHGHELGQPADFPYYSSRSRHARGPRG